MNTKLLRFSQAVVDDIRKGNYAIAEDFMGPDYVVNGERMKRSEYSHMGWAATAENENEWSLYLHSWFFGLFPRVGLIRGKERFIVKLSKVEHRGLAEIFRAIFEKHNDAIKEEKQLYKKRKELAYWQEGDQLLLGN